VSKELTALLGWGLIVNKTRNLNSLLKSQNRVACAGAKGKADFIFALSVATWKALKKVKFVGEGKYQTPHVRVW